TPLRLLSPQPGGLGLGLGTIDQLMPFHRSMRGTTAPELLAMETPTAKQLVVPVHDTPYSALYLAPGGLRLGTIDQLVPLHRSTSVTYVKEGLSKEVPTAKQLLVLVHDTLDSPRVLGLGT